MMCDIMITFSKFEIYMADTMPHGKDLLFSRKFFRFPRFGFRETDLKSFEPPF